MTVTLEKQNKYIGKKAYNHICIITFDNKILEAIRCPLILKHPNAINKLPHNLKENLGKSY